MTGAANNTRRQHGVTLVELMIATVLGLLLLLAATGLLLSSKTGYIVQDQAAEVRETGAYALGLLARAVRQAGYEYIDGDTSMAAMTAEASANVIGMDAMTLKKSDAALASATARGVVNGSDILAIRFFGDDTGAAGAAVLNCAGLAVAAAAAGQSAEDVRGWSIFFVAKDAGGEPELRCKYKTKNGWNADAIARGIESFQVLYGIDASGDSVPDRFVRASQVDMLDDTLVLDGANAAARMADLNRKTYWKKVRTIRVALLVRGEEVARDDALRGEYHLFGEVYSDLHARDDKGVRIVEQDLPVASRNRIRKIFSQTIQLRNDPAGSAS